MCPATPDGGHPRVRCVPSGVGITDRNVVEELQKGGAPNSDAVLAPRGLRARASHLVRRWQRRRVGA